MAFYYQSKSVCQIHHFKHACQLQPHLSNTLWLSQYICDCRCAERASQRHFSTYRHTREPLIRSGPWFSMLSFNFCTTFLSENFQNGNLQPHKFWKHICLGKLYSELSASWTAWLLYFHGTYLIFKIFFCVLFPRCCAEHLRLTQNRSDFFFKTLFLEATCSQVFYTSEAAHCQMNTYLLTGTSWQNALSNTRSWVELPGLDPIHAACTKHDQP